MQYAARDASRFNNPPPPDPDAVSSDDISKAAKAVATEYAPLLAKAINDQLYCFQKRAFIAALQEDGCSPEILQEYLYTVISEALASLGLAEAA